MPLWLSLHAYAIDTAVPTADLYGLVPVDVDNDGLLDLVGYGPYHLGIGLFPNVGGVLGARVDVTHDEVWDLVAIDTDGDGWVDLCSALDDDIVCRSNLGGTFGPAAVVVTASSGVHSLRAVDLDLDGDTDLLLTGSEVTWLDNDGAGAFTPQPISTDREFDAVAGDLDGDGDLDVLTTDYASHTVQWFDNQGGGTWAAIELMAWSEDPRVPMIADVDGDGLLDPIVLGGGDDDDPGVVWYPRLGTSFGAPVHITTESGSFADVTDVDGDGRLDLVAPDGAQGLVWVPLPLGPAGGPLVPAGDGGVTVLDADAADFDGDGVPELVAVSQDIVHYPVATGSVPLLVERGASTVLHVEAGDIDGDGQLDLVYGSTYDHRLAAHLGLGGGWGPALPVRTLAEVPDSLHLADVDVDGDLDLLVSAGAGVVRLDNDGTGAFAPEQSIVADGKLSRVVDLDGDGVLDLVATQPASVDTYMGDGSGGFTSTVSIPVPGLTSVDVGDLDGDGDLDIVATTTDDELVRIDATSPGVFGAAQLLGPTGSEPGAVAAVDFDADGDVDLVYEERGCPYNCSHLLVWRDNLGAGAFGPTTRVTGDANAPFALRDMDGDLLPDVVAATGTHLDLFTAASGFTGVDLTVAGSVADIVIEDLDGDGDFEVVGVQYGELFVLSTEGAPEPVETGETGETGMDTGTPATTPPTDTDVPTDTDAPTPEPGKPDDSSTGCGCATDGTGKAWADAVWRLTTRRRP